MEKKQTKKSEVNLAQSVTPQAVKPQIGLFLRLIEENYGSKLRMNEMTGRPEWLDVHAGRWQQWTDVDDARMAAYFQSGYGLYSPKMLESATMMYFAQRKMNPLIDLLEGLKWDGQSRIQGFLHYAIGAEDNDYTSEVSRLIFAGGIHRAYNPGCKFDDMAVLVGRQGGGKSTLVRWLNMDDQYYRIINTITGKEGVESLRGVWIGEVAELLAMTRVKEAEAVKAYITTQEDSYRAPYNRHVEVIPRRCIFIGTTNNPQFLSDKTGNRRFYPVQCAESGYDVFDREAEIRACIRQCWAEARELYKRGEILPFANRALLGTIQTAQRGAEEDDWRVGAIQQYLSDMKQSPDAMTCIIELWHRALGEPEESKPGRADSIEISKIMNEMEGWERCGKTARMDPWGVQKVYKKTRQDFFPF